MLIVACNDDSSFLRAFKSTVMIPESRQKGTRTKSDACSQKNIIQADYPRLMINDW